MGFPPLIVEEKATPFKWRQIILCRASLKAASQSFFDFTQGQGSLGEKEAM